MCNWISGTKFSLFSHTTPILLIEFMLFFRTNIIWRIRCESHVRRILLFDDDFFPVPFNPQFIGERTKRRLTSVWLRTFLKNLFSESQQRNNNQSSDCPIGGHSNYRKTYRLIYFLRNISAVPLQYDEVTNDAPTASNECASIGVVIPWILSSLPHLSVTR